MRAPSLSSGVPDGVLRDLVSLGEFSPLFSIGLPDSPSLPSLSFSSFKALSSRRAVSYTKIMKKITEKYKNLQNDPSDLDGASHFSKLNHNINNTNNNKSILIVPGV